MWVLVIIQKKSDRPSPRAKSVYKAFGVQVFL